AVRDSCIAAWIASAYDWRSARMCQTHIVSPGCRPSCHHQPAGAADLFAVQRCVPFYVYGIRYGWSGFALLTAILSFATVAGRIIFTWLTPAGMRRINLGRLEKMRTRIDR